MKFLRPLIFWAFPVRKLRSKKDGALLSKRSLNQVPSASPMTKQEPASVCADPTMNSNGLGNSTACRVPDWHLFKVARQTAPPGDQSIRPVESATASSQSLTGARRVRGVWLLIKSNQALHRAASSQTAPIQAIIDIEPPT